MQTDPGKRIEVRFGREFGIEDHPSVLCPYDFLKVSGQMIAIVTQLLSFVSKANTSLYDPQQQDLCLYVGFPKCTRYNTTIILP